MKKILLKCFVNLNLIVILKSLKYIIQVFIRKQLALYDELGIPEISLRAVSEGRGKDTFGGYVWAKYGFDFIDDVERLRVEREFKKYLHSTPSMVKIKSEEAASFLISPEGGQLNIEEVLPYKKPSLSTYSKYVSPDFVHLQKIPEEVIDKIEVSTARDMANWTFMDKEAAVPYGKMFLLETQWEAKLPLTPSNNPQRIIFEEYIGYNKPTPPKRSYTQSNDLIRAVKIPKLNQWISKFRDF